MPYQENSRSRLPLSADQTTALLEAALQFHTKAQEDRRDKRWWIPVLAAIMAFGGAVLGAFLKS